jgi:hypothetical protein
LPEERKPALGWPACNALNPRRAAVYSKISSQPEEPFAECGPALFQSDIPRNTGTILRRLAGGMTKPAVGIPAYTQSAF